MLDDETFSLKISRAAKVQQGYDQRIFPVLKSNFNTALFLEPILFNPFGSLMLLKLFSSFFTKTNPFTFSPLRTANDILAEEAGSSFPKRSSPALFTLSCLFSFPVLVSIEHREWRAHNQGPFSKNG